MFLPNPYRVVSYCLTCGGTGKRGNLSGKKLCKTCNGTGERYVEDSQRPGATIVDGEFTKVTAPKCFYPRLDPKDLVK